MGLTLNSSNASCISRNSFVQVQNIEKKLPKRRKPGLSRMRQTNAADIQRVSMRRSNWQLYTSKTLAAQRPATRLSDRPSLSGNASPQSTVHHGPHGAAAGQCATISAVGRYLSHTESTRLKISQRIEPLPLLDNIPFVVCMSTGQTHNIGLTVQQSLSLMKLSAACWPFNCSFGPLTNGQRQRRPRTKPDDGSGGARRVDPGAPHRLSEIAENECGVDRLSAVRYANKCRRMNRLTAKINDAVLRYAELTESLKYSLKINDVHFLREVEKKVLSQESVIKNRLEKVWRVLCQDDNEDSVVEWPRNHQIDTLQLLKKLKKAKVVENIFLTE